MLIHHDVKELSDYLTTVMQLSSGCQIVPRAALVNTRLALVNIRLALVNICLALVNIRMTVSIAVHVPQRPRQRGLARWATAIMIAT